MPVPGYSFADYHFARQLSDGTGADKPGQTPSRWNKIDGMAATWDLGNQKGYYNTKTVYFCCEKRLIMKKCMLSMVLILAMLTMMSCNGGNDMKFDNQTPYTEKITKTYHHSIFDSIREASEAQPMSIKALHSELKIECVRKTNQGSYIVFKQEDGKSVFIFADKGQNIYSVLRFKSFFRKLDFDFIQVGETTQDEILAFDDNAILYPVSSVEVSGHILNNGLLIIQYSRVRDGELLMSPVVSSIEFIDGSDYNKLEDNFFVTNTPYILPFDRNATD